MKNYVSSFEQVAVEKLDMDRTYQRSLSHERAKKIAKDFDPVGVGLISVHKRKDGRYFIVDGQHRYTAMKILGFTKINCNVYEGLTLIEEAKLFNFLNAVKQPTRLERAKSSVASYNETAIRIRSVVTTHGHQIDYESTGNGIKAYTTLEKIFKQGGQVGLSDVLGIINKAFPGEKDALGMDMMYGLFTFINSFKGRFDEKKLIRKIKEQTCAGILSKGRILAGANGCPNHKGVKLAITYFYDRGHKDKLGEI